MNLRLLCCERVRRLSRAVHYACHTHSNLDVIRGHKSGSTTGKTGCAMPAYAAYAAYAKLIGTRDIHPINLG
jgi:hypothetical protein